MKYCVRLRFIICFLLLSNFLFSQADSAFIPKEKKLVLNGYIKNLSSVNFPAGAGNRYFENVIHNRINLKWYVSNTVTFVAEQRNRFFWRPGSGYDAAMVKQVKESAGGLGTNWSTFMVHSVMDRAYLDCHTENWQIRAGKQRINWGKSLVWNPNDLFNAYSFIDFDYEERNGTDAVWIKRQLQNGSSLEVAATTEKSLSMAIAAAKYSYSRDQFDFQYIVGKFKQDIVAGVGLAGQIKDVGVKGELTYFNPLMKDTLGGALVSDVALDYTFPSSVILRLEALLNTNPVSFHPERVLINELTARSLSFDYITLYLSGGYDITPLIKANVAGIFYTKDGSFLINPSLSINLNQIELLFASQVFGGRPGSAFQNFGTMLFARLKWNF